MTTRRTTGKRPDRPRAQFTAALDPSEARVILEKLRGSNARANQ